MKAAGPATEVVNKNDHLGTAATAVKTKDTAVMTDDTAEAVDDVDVDDTAAVADIYLQTDAHTVSVFGMCCP